MFIYSFINKIFAKLIHYPVTGLEPATGLLTGSEYSSVNLMSGFMKL